MVARTLRDPKRVGLGNWVVNETRSEEEGFKKKIVRFVGKEKVEVFPDDGIILLSHCIFFLSPDFGCSQMIVSGLNRVLCKVESCFFGFLVKVGDDELRKKVE